MANELPYFRFTVSAWQNGKISLESFELQGLFISICGFYWIQDCSLTLAMLQKKFGTNNAKLIQELIDLEIIKHEKRHDKIEIEFLNIQYDLLSEKRKSAQDRGSKGGKAKAELKLKGGYKDKDKDKDKDKIIKTEIDSVNDLNLEKEKTAFTESVPAEIKKEKKEDDGIEFAEVMEWPSFDDFWDLYDKKADRDKCEKKFNSLSQDDKEKIMQHVPDYVAQTQDKTFRRHPATYLNNKSWNNEIITKQPIDNAKTRNQQGAAEAAEFLRNFQPQARS